VSNTRQLQQRWPCLLGIDDGLSLADQHGSCGLYLFYFFCLFAITSLICCESTKAEMTHFWHDWLFVNMQLLEKIRFSLIICSH